MQPLPLNALRVFESVVRLDSFRAAADELCVSQSAVSHQIKHLEDWFEDPLFDRTGNRPRPLLHAQRLAFSLEGSFVDIRLACQHARRRSDTSPLVIAAIPSVATCWLAPRLSAFRKRFPGIEIRIIYAFHGQKIDFSEIDLAFVYAEDKPQRAGTCAHLFLPGISAPVCSPKVSQSLQAKSLLDNSADIQFLHDSDNSGWEHWWRKAGSESLPEFAGITFEDFNLLRAAVLAGQGMALCPLAMVQEDLDSGHLVQLSDITVNESYNYYLFEHTDSDDITQNSREAFKSWLFEVRDADALTSCRHMYVP